LSALKRADKPEEIEFISYHDIDDESVYEYVGKHKEVYGERGIEIFRMTNECQKIAEGPIYMFTADDFTFTSDHWDTEVYQVFDQYEDKIVLALPDGIFWRNWHIGVIGFVHKRWVDSLGYLLPDFDGGQAADRYLNTLAQALDRRVRMKMTVLHANLEDDVHKEKNRRCRKERWSPKYWSPETELIRQKDIALLRSAIYEQNVCLLHR